MSDLKEVTIYTDGSCMGNPGTGGYGAILCYGDREKQISGGFRLTTNNRMEIMAASIGLEALKFHCSVTLYSDSKYLVESMTEGWVRRWQANNWWRNQKERAINVDLWKRLLNLCDQHDVRFVWVKGHSGHHRNEQCDVLSKKAASQQDLPIDKGYEHGREQSDHTNQFTMKGLTSSSKGRQHHEASKNMASEQPREEKTESQPTISNSKQIELDGKCYVWNGKMWYDAKSFLKPPDALIQNLNTLLIPELEREDKSICDVNQLLKRAQEARDSLQYRRAQELARRTLGISPGHAVALAILSSCLRANGHAQQALDETEAFKKKKYPALLTSRAAALCDLGRWEEAKAEIGYALAIGTDKDVSFSVVGRIKAARPDLYN